MAIGAVAAAVSIAGTVYGAAQQQRAGAAAEEAAEQQARARQARNRQARLAATRRRAEAIRDARIARGTLAARSASMGISGTPVSGAMSGIQGQLASNIGFAEQQFGIEQQRVGFMESAQESSNLAAARGAQSQTVGGLASGISGGLQQLAKL